MADLDPRLRELDGIQPPDLWSSIQSGQPPRRTPPLGWHRSIAAAVALLVGAAGVGWAGIAFLASRNQPVDRPPSHPAGHPIEVSAVDRSGTIRCTATFPSSVVEPGRKTGVDIRIENASDHATTVREGINGDYGALLIRDSSGKLLENTYDSHMGIRGPAPFPKRLAPGEGIKVGTDGMIVWPGPLQVEPYCVGASFHQIRLPAVVLRVFTPGPAPSANDAVSMALSVAGAFSSCRPTADGTPVVGTVPPHLDGSGEPFPARCQAVVIPNAGFDLVVIAIVSPPDAAPVDLPALAYEIAAVPSLSLQGSVAVSWWTYVATSGGVIKVRQWSIGQDCGRLSYSSGGGIASCPPVMG